MNKKLLFMMAGMCLPSLFYGQQRSQSWVADLGNGTYKNPVLNADYSDPDVCRAGNDFYMTASSFNAAPGLPILQSKDLVNWQLVGHALFRQPPFVHFSKVQHGNGVWAPSIRYHKGEFYIYYPDPDFGIYLIKAKHAAGPWSEPVMVKAGKGLIDPCPLWDDDGKVYLVHAWAGSRAGIKSILTLNRMNEAGTAVTDEGVLVFDGHPDHPTLEGPKLYKRNGYYYIFAPAGGVSTGWQLVLRSKNIYGPYEEKIVMDQGKSPVNGPHQGAWVDMPSGSSWFLHFQDKNAYGRVVHLQPLQWVKDWPVIGTDPDGDGKGEPVMTWNKPLAGMPVMTPPESDEFNGAALGKQWQWQANPVSTWMMAYPAKGVLRLFSARIPDSTRNLWQTPNLLLQKFPADSFTVTTKCTFTPNPKLEGERTGLIVLGVDYAGISLISKNNTLKLVYTSCLKADKGAEEQQEVLKTLDNNTCWFRVTVVKDAVCQFSYSLDGTQFTDAGKPFTAQPGRWVGAKVGIYCTRDTQINDAGFADYDWFRITK
ncbi:glycoside hydrolase 43 family protein [Chitinophaga sp. B61]|uniref:Glycoside hydrolase 43 family protein n=2 Tax=Chitinophaga rhizophila TaxID=2866212 RepID=A0ABS7GKF0_9BACT|nr:glycoside hydrolase 43 family protein [Chitinophaga rhizophila]